MKQPTRESVGAFAARLLREGVPIARVGAITRDLERIASRPLPSDLRIDFPEGSVTLPATKGAPPLRSDAAVAAPVRQVPRLLRPR